ncbi:hypothetical protein D9615_002731 [Tricholomella constricta]|uniref:Peptidase A1 domain-containing protein n=1 Tax=Tricholomella constricta TaxID=117010 RepID=A0A8H5HFJ8_9AGAR|nr:hypothetical protein D9615_002731 [Tricholomella constricta]
MLTRGTLGRLPGWQTTLTSSSSTSPRYLLPLMGLLHYVVLLAYLIALASALRLNIHGVRKASHSSLRRRALGSELNNTADVSYYAEIKVGGKRYTLLVDTGSSDLWIAGNVPNSNFTRFSSGVNYAVGALLFSQGPIKTAEVEFVGHTIPDQALLEVTPDRENKDDEGIIGLGPNAGSNIYQEMKNVAGAALVDRIFLQNRTTPNYLTFLLGRSDDPTDFYSGSLTIGEVLDRFEDVLKQPKLPVVDVAAHESNDQHFQILLDENGFIGPDGKSIPIRSEVTLTRTPKQAIVVVDTGFSLPQVPSSVAAAIYSRFVGAQLVDIGSVGEIWILPCKQEVNITLKFHGDAYNPPVLRLPKPTLSDPNTIGLHTVEDSAGNPLCIGTFQPFSYNRGPSPNYDMVLGMAFLRNVYVLVDYGDFIVGSNNKADPYLQFLSTTDAVEAHADFVNVRLNGVDTTGSHGGIKKRGVRPMVYYIVITVIVVGVLTALAVFFIFRRRRNRKLAAQGSSVPHAAPDMSVLGPPPSYSYPQGPYVMQPPQSYHPQHSPYAQASPPNNIHVPPYPHQHPHDLHAIPAQPSTPYTRAV